jgi:hypothetical protein
MKSKYIVVIIALITATVFSCSKNEELPDPTAPPVVPTGPLTKRDMLLGRWTLISITHLEKNGPGRFQYKGSANDYFNFKKDSIITYVQGFPDNVRYQLMADDSTLLFYKYSAVPMDTLFITALTSNLLVLKGKTDAIGNIGIDSLRK